MGAIFREGREEHVRQGKQAELYGFIQVSLDHVRNRLDRLDESDDIEGMKDMLDKLNAIWHSA